jgi:PPOX class probable F420-dependent enzyme
MDHDPSCLPPEVVRFVSEPHLATLSTRRRDGSPQLTPVGLTYDQESKLARIITWAGSFKARNIERDQGQRVAACQVDGGRWLTFYGPATVSNSPARVAEAVERYRQRYRPPSERDDRVVIEIAVDRIVGRA